MSCSTGPAPTDVLEGVIRTESNGYVYALSGSYDQQSYFRLPKTKKEQLKAIAVARISLSEGINVSVGLMQINSWHIKRIKNLSINVAFRPCTNVLIGSSILAEIMGRLCPENVVDDACIDQSLMQYNTGKTYSTEAGRRYVSKVRKNMRR